MRYYLALVLFLISLPKSTSFNFYMDNIQDYCFKVYLSANDSLKIRYLVQSKAEMK